MTRPKSKKNRKGRTLPMNAYPNGNSANNVPADIVWDENDPPIIFACSQHITHARECDGTCETHVATELQVELMNEARAWARLDMNFFGIPQAYAGVFPIRGINVELWDLECKYQVLREIVIEVLNFDEQELEERFARFKLMAMRNIRERNEAEIRRQRAADMLGVAQKKPIIGPDGNPLL